MRRKLLQYSAAAVATAASGRLCSATQVITPLDVTVGADSFTDVYPNGTSAGKFTDVANNTDGVWLKNNISGIEYASSTTTPGTIAPDTTGFVGPSLTYSRATSNGTSLNVYLTNTATNPSATPFATDGSTQYVGFEIPATGGGYNYGDIALQIIPTPSKPGDFTTTLLETRYDTTPNEAIPTQSGPPAPTYNVLPLGDSITAGGGVNEANNGGYRTQLVTNLVGAGIPVQLQGSNVLSATDPNTPAVLAANGGQGLHCEGHGGYTISQIDNNLLGSDPTTSDNNGGDWLDGVNGRGSAATTNCVLLHIGTNDILQLYGSHSESNPISDSDLLPIEARMTKLVTDLRTDLPNAKLLIASIIPIPDPFYDTKITGDNITFTSSGKNDYQLNHYVLLYDAWIKDTLVPSFASSGDVFYVDQYDSQIDSNGNIIAYSDYGVHPTTAGYNLIGATWANAVEQVDSVPEPASASLLVAAAFGLLGLRRVGR